MIKKLKEKAVSQIVSMPQARISKKINGHGNGEIKYLGKNSRTFETRFVPRYEKMPSLPTGLAEPTFSESSNKILQERYLLKG